MRLVYWLVLPTCILSESHHIGISASDINQSDNALRLAMQSASCQRIASYGKSHIAQCSSSDGHHLIPIFSPVSRQSLTISIYAKIPKPVLPKNFQTTPIRKNSETTPLYAKNFQTKPTYFIRKLLMESLYFFVCFLLNCIRICGKVLTR